MNVRSNLLFQYCQKIIVLSKDRRAVLLAKRKGEADYDGTYSFIGGKMVTSDKTIIDGIKREKDEEIGRATIVKILAPLPRGLPRGLLWRRDARGEP